MSRKTRTILFLGCAILFLLTAPSVILYSQGYRIDFEKRKLVKTGAFYFKVSPKGAEIFINGKLRKKTDFFFASAFIDNLLPKKYLVEIKKTGYQSWRKNLEINEAQVTEAKNIVLLPKKPAFKLLEKNLINVFPSPDERKFILEKQVFNNKEKSWNLKLYDLNTGLKSHLIDEKEISETGALLLNLIWSPDSKRIVLKTEIENQKKYFLMEINQGSSSLTPLDFLEESKNFSFHPTNPKKLFFTKIEGESLVLFEKNLNEENEKTILKQGLVYKISNNNIIWLSKDGFLQKNNLSGNNPQKLNLEPIAIEKTNYQLEVLNSYIFLKQGEKLFFFDENTRKFSEIGEKIKFLKISPDSKKVCLSNNSEIWVLFLKERVEQPSKTIGSKLFLTRFSKKIGQVFWLTSHYLIFNADSEIKTIEIDDRDKIQIWNLADFSPNDSFEEKSPKIYFSQRDKKLYLLNKGNFFVSEKLL